MTQGDEDKICGKLDNIQKDVSDTKESVGRIEERVNSHGEALDRHENKIDELTKSRNKHDLALNTIEVEDETKERLRAKYSTKKQFRITRTMWIIGILVSGLIAVSGWCIILLKSPNQQ